MSELTKDLDGVILNDARLGFLKKAFAKHKNPEVIRDVLILFAYKYFTLEGGTESIGSSWKNFIATEEIKGVNLKGLTKLSANQCSGLMNAIRSVVEKPVYKVKEQYLNVLPTRRLGEVMGCYTSATNSIHPAFPKISVVSDIFSEGIIYNSHVLKKRMAEKAMEGLKSYLENSYIQKSKQTQTTNVKASYIALAGGTTILRVVNAIINALDEDNEFYSMFYKMKPFKIVEMADPGELLTSYGLSENTRTTYLAFTEMGLSGEKDYLTYEQVIKQIKEIELQAMYTGLGKPEDVTPASNTRLQSTLKEAGIQTRFLFELNSVPYYDESIETKKDDQKKLQQFLIDKKVIPIENLKSNYKIVISGGIDKAKAIYNLIRYTINNPEKKLVTHLITDYTTFKEVVTLAKTNSNYAE